MDLNIKTKFNLGEDVYGIELSSSEINIQKFKISQIRITTRGEELYIEYTPETPTSLSRYREQDVFQTKEECIEIIKRLRFERTQRIIGTVEKLELDKNCSIRI